MKRILALLFAVVLVSMPVFQSCDTLQGLASFANCQFALNNVSNPSVGGVDFSKVNDFNNLNAASLVKLTAAISQGSLPFSTTFNIKATNPNSTAAKIQNLEWAIDLEGKQLLQGVLNQSVNVPASGGQSVIPLTVSVDLLKIANGGSRNDLLNLASNFVNAGTSSSKISLRVKPTVMVGNFPISTGFITLSKNVG